MLEADACPVPHGVCIALSLLWFVVLYDLRHTIVPEVVSYLLLAVSFLFAVMTASPHALGLVLVVSGIQAGLFLALHVLSSGRAMGLGDVPVVLALSLLVGSAAIPGLLFSFWIGGLYGIIVLVTRRGGPKMGIEVPFVPFLAAGFLLAYFSGWNPLPF